MNLRNIFLKFKKIINKLNPNNTKYPKWRHKTSFVKDVLKTSQFWTLYRLGSFYKYKHMIHILITIQEKLLLIAYKIFITAIFENHVHICVPTNSLRFISNTITNTVNMSENDSKHQVEQSCPYARLFHVHYRKHIWSLNSLTIESFDC